MFLRPPNDEEKEIGSVKVRELPTTDAVAFWSPSVHWLF